MSKVRTAWTVVAVVCTGMLLASPRWAAAQLSSHAGATTGSTCSGANNADGFCGFVRTTNTATGTQFVSRYAWNINADVGTFSTRDTSGTAVHGMTFTATAPGSYQVVINQSFVGAMGRINDLAGCDGQANVSGVTGSTNIALNSGSLTVTDPGSIGNGGSTTSTGFAPTAAGTIGPRLSNGLGQAHSLSFTFNGNVRSNSCEASVRLGQTNGSTTGCSACVYPGSPSRTQATDGHFVTVNFTSFCGDSVINGTGETCDQGGANGTAGSCCNTNCTLKTNGTGCTDDGNVCTNDTCNGVSPICQHPNNSASCTDSIFCNGTDTCSGGTCALHTGNPCPGADGDGNCSESCNEAADNCLLADPNGSACNDALFCNGTDTCSAGACSGHTGNPCPGADGDGNCSESCNEASDNCLLADPNGSACTDSLFCNGTDTCASGACTGHTGNPCPGPDGDGNCSESCNEASDNCLLADPNGSACTDSLFCNGTDTCAAGACTGHTGDPCPGADGDGNCSESCNEGADNCLLADPNGSACTDSLFCNGTDTCGGGTCTTHTGDPCPGPDGDGNCAESCDEGVDNCLANDTDGSACTDGLFCSGTETCTTGSCTNSTGDPCPGPDGDGDCTETCDEGADNCAGNDLDGSACTDGFFCTQTDACSTGTCVGAGDPCPGPDGDNDCAESCNEGGDDCLGNDPNGSSCNDALFCNGNDTCGGGTCTTHAGDPCTGGTECADACNETADDCNDLSGTGCTDDTNPCTTDTCDGGGTCAHPAGNPGASCRPVAGDCDIAENCDGTNAACPTDGFVAGGTECRATGGICDVAENCTGSAAACPVDGFEPNTVECRADAGECDVAENCTGSGALCPTNGFDPDGAACDDSSLCTFGEFCTAGACGDGTDTNTTCAPCEGCDPGTGTCEPDFPRTNCLQPTVANKARVLIKDKSNDSGDLVVWKWIKGEETVLADFGDPENTQEYTLCVFDNGTTKLEATIPAGGTCGTAPCWKPIGTNGFKYIDRERTPEGILKVLLKTGADGKAKVIVKGKGVDLPLGAGVLPMQLPVDVQLQATGGACWGTSHGITGPFLNTTEMYKAVDTGP